MSGSGSTLPRPTFTSWLRSPAVAARVGVWLGVCFGLAFVTGIISHWAQTPDPLIPFPTHPAWGYRFTQGLHVLSGIVSVPLLLVKLWTVYPLLFRRPPGARPIGPLVREALERASIGVLVAAAIFELVTGLTNQAQWYRWGFPFRSVHYAVAWVAIGALVLHIAVKLPVIREAFERPPDDGDQPRTGSGGDGHESHGAESDEADRASAALTRRGLLAVTGIAGLTAFLATAGNSVPFLRQVSVLAVRSGTGPGGIPINISAAQARVQAAATAGDYQLTLVHGGREMSFTRADLEAMEQHTETLPIACVEGWSASGSWSGVRMRDLLARVGAPADADVKVVSMQQRGAFAQTLLQSQFAQDPRTLLALRLEGETLALDHGYPARVIAPNRPGVLQTKWVQRLEVQA